MPTERKKKAAQETSHQHNLFQIPKMFDIKLCAPGHSVILRSGICVGVCCSLLPLPAVTMLVNAPAVITFEHG